MEQECSEYKIKKKKNDMVIKDKIPGDFQVHKAGCNFFDNWRVNTNWC